MQINDRVIVVGPTKKSYENVYTHQPIELLVIGSAGEFTEVLVDGQKVRIRTSELLVI
jgi:hypothetical protein